MRPCPQTGCSITARTPALGDLRFISQPAAPQPSGRRGRKVSSTRWEHDSRQLVALPCRERRLTTAVGWAPRTDFPFDYVDEFLRHRARRWPGLRPSATRTLRTGAWGGTRTGPAAFLHGAATISATTCVACHTTQRFDGGGCGFDHSVNGTGDCLGCHQATVAARKYVR